MRPIIKDDSGGPFRQDGSLSCRGIRSTCERASLRWAVLRAWDALAGHTDRSAPAALLRHVEDSWSPPGYETLPSRGLRRRPDKSRAALEVRECNAAPLMKAERCVREGPLDRADPSGAQQAATFADAQGCSRHLFGIPVARGRPRVYNRQLRTQEVGGAPSRARLGQARRACGLSCSRNVAAARRAGPAGPVPR